MRISNLEKESGEKVINAFIPGWNPHETVRFPAALVPKALHDALKPNVRLFARVNIAAETSEELYFEKFELATPPDDNDGLA